MKKISKISNHLPFDFFDPFDSSFFNSTFGDIFPRIQEDHRSKQFNQLVESFLKGINSNSFPKCSIYEKKEELHVDFFVPYITKEKIEVEVDSQLSILTVSGHSFQDKEVEEGSYHLRELSRSSFSRSVSIPERFDLENVKSTELKDGILKIVIGKRDSKEEKHKVKLSIK